MRDGEEIEIFGWVTVQRWSRVRGSNPVCSHEETKIGAGDSMMHLDYVTHWVAKELEANLGIDLEASDEYDIEVVDPTADDVEVV